MSNYEELVEVLLEYVRLEYERGARDGLTVGYAYGYDNARYVRGRATYAEHQLWQRGLLCQHFPDGFSLATAYTESLWALSVHCAFHPVGDANKPPKVYPMSKVQEFIRSPESVAVCDAARRHVARAEQNKAPNATTPGADDGG